MVNKCCIARLAGLFSLFNAAIMVDMHVHVYYTNIYLHVMQYCLNWGPIHVQFGTNLSCEHLFKYLNPPSTLLTSSKTITRVKMSNVKTSKGALIGGGFHMLNMFVRLYAHEAKLLTQVLK